MTAPGQVLRRVFVAVGEALRPRRWTVLFLAALTELVILGGLGLVHGEDAALAIAVSFMVLTAVAAGTLAGPLVGALAAFVGGAIFYATVAHFGTDQSFLVTAVSTAIWLLAALLAGIIAEALREQVTKREEASVALTQAQAVRQTAEHLLEATAAFHGGESPRQVADDVCRAALSSFDCVSVALSLVEEASLRTVATAPRRPLGAGHRVSLDDHPSLAGLIALERPTFFAEAQSSDAFGTDATPILTSILPDGAVAFVPLRSGEEPLALLTLEWDRGTEQPENERLAVMQRFADQASVAMLEAWRAQAHSEAARLHATLEAGLLPIMPIDHRDLEIVTAYRPGEDRLLLGGDFYDVMPLPDGRLALILGDVAGHGPNAAALGARLRAGWQALTLSGAAPSAILGSLSQMVAAQPDPEQFVTVVLAWIDPGTCSAALLSAGHPPPLLLSSAVQPIHLPAHLPLGFDEDSRLRPTTVKLPAGWTLFFYTDGLIEGRAAPGSPERYGEDGLMRRLQDAVAGGFDAEALDCVLAEIEAANGAAFGDDVAVVAVSQKRAAPRHARTA
ncbi:MAG TPA: SpoIIE family protein phosphatase [Thermoleophilia bacterium]